MSNIDFPGGDALDPGLALRSHERPDLLSPNRESGALDDFVPHQSVGKAYVQAAGGELVPVIDTEMGVLVTISRHVLATQSFPDLEGLGRREGCL